MSKNIITCCNGTGNEYSIKNVFKLYSLIEIKPIRKLLSMTPVLALLVDLAHKRNPLK